MSNPALTTPRTLHKSLKGHTGPVHIVRYAKGSAKYVLSGGQDRTVRLFNPDSGNQIQVFNAHGYEVLGISVYVNLNTILWGIIRLSVIQGS